MEATSRFQHRAQFSSGGLTVHSRWVRPNLRARHERGSAPTILRPNSVSASSAHAPMSRPLFAQHLEQHGTAGPDRAVVLSAFQHATHFTPATAARYERLARRCSLVGAIARDLRPFVAGVRHGTLTAGHPLEREWTVTVVTPHYAGALIAREHHGMSDHDSERVFDYVITYDRPTVVAAARSLMQHLAPIGSTWVLRASSPPATLTSIKSKQAKVEFPRTDHIAHSIHPAFSAASSPSRPQPFSESPR